MNKTEFFSHYRQIFDKNNLSAYTIDTVIEKMFQMTEHMLSINESMNLTAITAPHDIIVKHLADCCTILDFLPPNSHVCDIGCGGGFPSLPIAIARPDITVLGIDSTGKKVNYINETAKILNLNNLSAVCGRAEDLAAGELREKFDVVTARAVAALPMLCELCIPFVRVGGLFCAMKAKPSESEINQASSAYTKLGAPLTPQSIHAIALEDETRMIIITQKQSRTPTKYPRPFPQIKKKPL